MKNRSLWLSLSGLILLVLGFSISYFNRVPNQQTPVAKLSAEDVLEIQLKALRNNNDQDEGIAIVYNYASSANKEGTGNLEDFKEMMHSSVYSPMLNHKNAKISTHFVEGNAAEFFVFITTKKGAEYAYIFQMSKENIADQGECWVTDAVVLFTPPSETDGNKSV